MRERTLRERVLSKAIINWETGCWEWIAAKDRDGYGRTTIDKVGRIAHRVAYELIMGPIPAGLQLDHLCRNRACVNPAHLEPVTQQENQLRSPITIAVVNAAKTHCPQGHEYTPENTQTSSKDRHCRICNRAAVARYKQRRRLAATTSEGPGR